MKTYFTLAISALLFAACGSEPTGKNSPSIDPKLNEIEEELIEEAKVKKDTLVDTVDVVVAPTILPIPAPGPMPPDPDPDPWPASYPMPPPPRLIPEPIIIESARKGDIIDFPDVEANFPGSDSAMFEFIQNTLVYPEVGKEMGDQGRVYLSFIIEKDGSLTNVKIMRGVSKSLDREAKRVVRKMPNWTPAKFRGAVVRSRMRLPIAFKLE
jgi:TonB family protein